MTSYQMELINDTLNVDFGETLTPGNIIVAEVEAQLKQLIKSQKLSGGHLLKIFGRISVPLSYTIAHQVSHLYKVVAVSDTRLNAYVVVNSTDSNYTLGSRLDLKTGKLQDGLTFLSEQNDAFLFNWEENILNVSLNRQVEVDGDVIVREVSQKLDFFCSNNQLKGGQLLKIKGRATVLSSFVIAQKLAHLYGAIAVYDPKLGTSELDKYIIAISHDPSYQVGDTLDEDIIAVSDVPRYQVGDTLHEKNGVKSDLKVVLCGPPNTGKTCLREGLQKALGQLPLVPDFFVISGCPDGDGSWFSETAQKNREFAEELKRKYKASFTPEFAQEKARQIQAIKKPLLIFDVGGEISPENKVIMKQANHAIILVKNDNDIREWQEFCQELNLSVIAIIYSDLEASHDTIIENHPPILRGIIHHLHRQVDASQRPMVKALAEVLISILTLS